MQTLTLNDGTVLSDSYAAESLDALFLYIKNGLTLPQVFWLVSIPEKVDVITYTAGDTVVEYTGYTVIQGITSEHDGMISVVLRRG